MIKAVLGGGTLRGVGLQQSREQLSRILVERFKHLLRVRAGLTRQGLQLTSAEQLAGENL